MTSYCSICKSSTVVGFVVTRYDTFHNTLEVSEYRCSDHIKGNDKDKYDLSKIKKIDFLD